ncbi:transcription factor HES-5-like [Ascaphus truei]|uniref:transcription factor HES-5-like n=1 Tax=Ascaphus truei TaxID=8439 RepID=UPI003F5A56CA
MAPCNIRMQGADNSKSKQIRKMRKPVIEKMRRDRINSSIEQLKTLLEKEFQKHELPSKPEKADILEMTVSFLQQHMAEKSAPSPNQTHREGHSRCLQDSLHFLFLHKQTEAQEKLLRNINGPLCDSEVMRPSVLSSCQPHTKQTAQKSTKVPWRPW